MSLNYAHKAALQAQVFPCMILWLLALLCTTCNLPAQAPPGNLAPVSGRCATGPRLSIPVQGARLFLQHSPPARGETPVPCDSLSSRTGQFKIPALPPGLYLLSAETSGLVSSVITLSHGTSPTVGVVIPMDAATTATGTVLTNDGDPKASATVSSIRVAELEKLGMALYDEMGTSRSQAAITDHAGNFRIPHVPAVPLFLQAKSLSHSTPARRYVNPLDQETSTVLKFPSVGEFSIVALDTDFLPVAAGSVSIYYQTSGTMQEETSPIPQNGQVVFKNIPGTALERVVVESPGYQRQELTGVKVPQQAFPAFMTPLHKLSVLIDSPSTQTCMVSLMHCQSCRAGQEDSFSTRESIQLAGNSVTFENLTAGWYKVQVASQGLFGESLPVEFTEKTLSREVRISLYPGTIRGRILMESTSAPITGALIRLRLANTTPYPGGERYTQSDNNGNFRFEDSPPGLVELEIAHGKLDPQRELVRVISSQTTDVTVVLTTRTGTISGKVTSGGTPIAGALVYAARERSTESPIKATQTLPDGSYRLELLPPGKLILWVEAAVGAKDRIVHRGIEFESGKAEVTADIDFLQPVQVRFLVNIAGKTPGKAGNITFLPRSNEGTAATAEYDATGAGLVELEPGEYAAGLEDLPGIPVTITSPPSPGPLLLSYP